MEIISNVLLPDLVKNTLGKPSEGQSFEKCVNSYRANPKCLEATYLKGELGNGRFRTASGRSIDDIKAFPRMSSDKILTEVAVKY